MIEGMKETIKESSPKHNISLSGFPDRNRSDRVYGRWC